MEAEGFRKPDQILQFQRGDFIVPMGAERLMDEPFIAPQRECPQMMMSLTPSPATANSMAAASPPYPAP